MVESYLEATAHGPIFQLCFHAIRALNRGMPLPRVQGEQYVIVLTSPFSLPRLIFSLASVFKRVFKWFYKTGMWVRTSIIRVVLFFDI